MVLYRQGSSLQYAVIRSSAVFFFIANEGLSILENAGLMGIKLPGKLKDALEKLAEKKDEHG